MWVQIVIALIEWLGPILAEAFKNWLENRLRQKAQQLSLETASVKFGVAVEDSDEHRLMLLNAVRDDLWFWQVGKKRAVDACITAVKAKNRFVGRVGYGKQLIGEGCV